MPLARHDRFAFRIIFRFCIFLLTCLLRGMTGLPGADMQIKIISTHMPLARHDFNHSQSGMSGMDFYSHASCEA